MPATGRSTFEQLADDRIAEARALLASGHFSGAYYLAGYSLECGIKVVICATFSGNELPDKRQVEAAYSHNLESLIRVAGLEGALSNHIKSDAQFATNWSIGKDWNEQSRYRRLTQVQATDLCDAVDDPTKGVLAWLKGHW